MRALVSVQGWPLLHQNCGFAGGLGFSAGIGFSLGSSWGLGASNLGDSISIIASFYKFLGAITGVWYSILGSGSVIRICGSVDCYRIFTDYFFVFTGINFGSGESVSISICFFSFSGFIFLDSFVFTSITLGVSFSCYFTGYMTSGFESVHPIQFL